MIVGTLTPNNYYAPIPFVTSLLSVANIFPISFVQGPYIAGNRNLLLEKAKKANESLLMVDADTVFTVNDVKKVDADLKKLDVVTGVYVDGKLHKPVIFKKDEEYVSIEDIENDLFEIDACGAGFLGISKEWVQKLPDDAFTPFEHTKGGEDISFCERVKDLGGRIHCDGEIKIGHVRQQILQY